MMVDKNKKIKEVRAVYFSATDTTRKIVTAVASNVAEIFRVEYREDSFSLPDERLKTLKFDSESIVIFGLPVYAGRVPNLLLPWLTTNINGGDAYAVPIVLFGNRAYDDSLIELRNILENIGFHTISAGAFVGEHSFSDTLAKGRPDDDDFSIAVKLAQKTAEIITSIDGNADGCNDLSLYSPVKVSGNDPVGPYYKPRDRNGEFIDIRKVKPKTNMSECTNCGICVDVCTMGAIDPADVSKIPGTCTKCCACIKKCPEGAKFFDDKGFLYHKHELEYMFRRRTSVELFP